jgi:uncharacterized protein (TIGR03067 family)
MYRTLTVLIVLGLVGFMPARADDKKKDQEALKGTWNVTKATMNGQPMPNAENIKLEFTEDQVTPKMPNREDNKPAKYTLDPSKSPKQIDIMAENETMHGIYEIKEDTLRLCLGKANNRPSSFDAVGEMVILIEAKKQK